jgi:argininosuccinate lyase
MLQSVTGLLSGLPTGYNRDSREVKEYITNGLSLTETGLSSLIETVSTLQVHEDKMLEAVEENYSLTTDIADGLAQETGIPYRKMYDIVGEAVNQAIKDGRSLSELSQSDIEQQAQEEGVELSLEGIDLKNLLDPETALSKRTHTGGTAPEELDHQISRMRDENQQLQSWVDTQNERIADARNRTQNAIQNIING